MAGHGPAPKDAERRQRRNTSAATVEIPAGARMKRPPPLPKAPAAVQTWSAATRAWYETWRRSPQSTMFTPTDWQRLQMLAALVEGYYRQPAKELLGEIRLNEAKLGATPEDRQRLHWTITEDDEPAPPATRPSRRRKDPRHLALVERGK